MRMTSSSAFYSFDYCFFYYTTAIHGRPPFILLFISPAIAAAVISIASSSPYKWCASSSFISYLHATFVVCRGLAKR